MNELIKILQKPVAMMTGEELVFMLKHSLPSSETKSSPADSGEHFVYGINGIAKLFGCSVPTANRIKKSGVINDAITQVGRKIVVEAQLALKLVKEAEAKKSDLYKEYDYE
jgi:hypothetical protein